MGRPKEVPLGRGHRHGVLRPIYLLNARSRQIALRRIKRHSAFVRERRLSSVDRMPCAVTPLTRQRLLMAEPRPKVRFAFREQCSLQLRRMPFLLVEADIQCDLRWSQDWLEADRALRGGAATPHAVQVRRCCCEVAYPALNSALSSRQAIVLMVNRDSHSSAQSNLSSLIRMQVFRRGATSAVHSCVASRLRRSNAPGTKPSTSSPSLAIVDV